MLAFKARAMVQVVSRQPLIKRVGFDPNPVHVRCVVGRVILRQVFLPELLFFPPVSIILLLLHIHLHLRVDLSRRTSGRSLGLCRKQ